MTFHTPFDGSRTTLDIVPLVLTDDAVVRTFVEATPFWLAYVLVFLTYLGSVYVLGPVALYAYFKDRERFGPWIGALLGYYSLMGAIKSLNSATRPEVTATVGPGHYPGVFHVWVEHATALASTSFPSGHVMATTIFAGLFIFDTNVSTRGRRMVAGVALVAFIAYSRLALGVHYPIDVLGGVGLGLGFLGGTYWIRARVRDETGALFALAAVLAFISVWVINGVSAVPTVNVVAGQDRPITLGFALGGLLAWSFLDSSDSQTLELRALSLSGFGLSGLLIGASAVFLTLSHPVVTMVWAAIAMAVVIVIPVVFPSREMLTSVLDRLSINGDDRYGHPK